VYVQLTGQVTVGNNPWSQKEWFDGKGVKETNTTLEWMQSSPPVLHTFNELPYVVKTAEKH
jgi:heme/copper-type cytochrome/quinol oxidase subunit 1